MLGFTEFLILKNDFDKSLPTTGINQNGFEGFQNLRFWNPSNPFWWAMWWSAKM